MADESLRPSAPPALQPSYGATESSQQPAYPAPANTPGYPSHGYDNPPYPTAMPAVPTATSQSEVQSTQNPAADPTVAGYQYPQPGQQGPEPVPSEPPPPYEPPKDPSAYPVSGYPQQPYPVQGQPGYQSGAAYTYSPYPPQQTVVIDDKFGPQAKTTTCPYCQNSITTRISFVTGSLTLLSSGLLCLFCCWLCFCIPFCMNGTKDVIHHCPNCNRMLGTYKRM